MSIFGRLFGGTSSNALGSAAADKFRNGAMHPIEAKVFLQRMVSGVHDETGVDPIIALLQTRSGDELANKALKACEEFKTGRAGTRRCSKCSAEWHSLHLAMVDGGVYEVQPGQTPQGAEVQGLTCSKCNESYCAKCLPTVIISAAQSPLIAHTRRSGPSCVGYFADK